MTVPWEEGIGQVRELLDRGRQARDAGRLAEAATLFRQAYDLEPSAFAASRYLHCLRRQGPEKARAAVRFAQEPVQRWPLETWLIREYVWAIYDGYLKASGGEAEEAEAEPRPEFAVAVKAARRILKLSDEQLPRTRAVFAICRLAKGRGEWATVLEFAQALDPESLSDEPRPQSGHTIPSDRQQWYGQITRACLELARYDECCRFAQEGMERYPNVMLFPRCHGLARVRGGEVEVGLGELESLEHRFVVPWYVRRDIGEVYERLGRDGEAWGWYCAAVCSAGEIQVRIPMVARMGRLLERLDRAPLALDHLRLAWALAAQEASWAEFAARSREEVEAFLERQASNPGLSTERLEASPDPEPLLAHCRQAWAESRR